MDLLSFNIKLRFNSFIILPTDRKSSFVHLFDVHYLIYLFWFVFVLYCVFVNTKGFHFTFKFITENIYFSMSDVKFKEILINCILCVNLS